jgi:hypothetical protein
MQVHVNCRETAPIVVLFLCLWRSAVVYPKKYLRHSQWCYW